MASLQSRLTDLITAIGADIKALQNETEDQHNASTAAQTGFAADTYLAGSMVSIPQNKIKQGTKYRCRFNVVKTAAGTAAPVLKLRVGTAGTTADGERVSLSFAAQTAVVDEGEFDIECVFRSAGLASIVQALARLSHRLATTGLNITATNTFVIGTAGTSIDTTLPNLKMGWSVNGGASAAWTVSLVSAELINLTP